MREFDEYEENHESSTTLTRVEAELPVVQAPVSPEASTRASGGRSLAMMPLLDMVTRQSMDEDYAIVAQRRTDAGRQGPAQERRWGTGVTVAVVAASALLATIAAVQTSRTADVTALGRAGLVERIQLAKENVRELQDRSGALSSSNAEIEEQLRELRSDEERVTAQVRRLGARTGYLAVRGPGIRVTVDDATTGETPHVVRDSDLGLLVDGLWSAGAEAIAINGQRLTTLSPLQNSGQAIHVNVRPLTPPYRVEAIGDPETLEARLLASNGGAIFRGVADSLGFGLTVEDVEELELPATRVRQLKYASREDRDGSGRQEGDK